MRLQKKLLVLLFVSLFFNAFSQEKKAGMISGSVKESRSKLPLNEAVVTLSSTAFQGQKFALTDSSGMYRIANLPAGTYTISFEMEGYEKFVQQNIVLQPGMSLGVSFEMAKERRGKDKNVKLKKDSIQVIKKEED